MATMKLTDQEKEALIKAMQLQNQGKQITVKCPRCGNTFVGEISGSSSYVQCKTPNCIHLTCRGI